MTVARDAGSAHAGRFPLARVIAIGVLPALYAAAFLVAGDALADGGWGALGALSLLVYGGFPAAASITGAIAARLGGHPALDAAVWALAALCAYAGSWLVLAAVSSYS